MTKLETFFSRITEPISTKLGSVQLNWIEGIQGPSFKRRTNPHIPMGEIKETVKIPRKLVKKIFLHAESRGANCYQTCVKGNRANYNP